MVVAPATVVVPVPGMAAMGAGRKFGYSVKLYFTILIILLIISTGGRRAEVVGHSSGSGG